MSEGEWGESADIQMSRFHSSNDTNIWRGVERLRMQSVTMRDQAVAGEEDEDGERENERESKTLDDIIDAYSRSD